MGQFIWTTMNMFSFLATGVALLGLARPCSAVIDHWATAQGTCGWGGTSFGKGLNAQQCAERAVNECQNGFFYHSPSYPSWGCGCCSNAPDWSATHAHWRVYAFGEKVSVQAAYLQGGEHVAGPASRCIDNNFDSGNFCHSNFGSNRWLRLDLGSTKNVQRLLLNNRKDCCDDRLGTFEIWVGNDASNPTSNTMCTRHTASTQGIGHVTATCNSAVSGRYAFVYLPGSSRILNLQETRVYVHADPVPAMHYVGCYDNSLGSNRIGTHVSNAMTYDECKWEAFKDATLYFGLEYPAGSDGTNHAQCLAIDSHNWQKVDDSECEDEVDAAGNRLGNAHRVALYTHAHNTPQPTGSPTTKSPTAAPTTAEFQAQQMTLASLAIHEWTTGVDTADNLYKCHDFEGCFRNKPDARETFDIVDRPDGVDFSPATEYPVADGVFTIDAERITFQSVAGEEFQWPYSCACA